MSTRISKDYVDQWFAHNLLIPKRVIYLGEEIDSEVAGSFIKAITVLGSVSPERPIDILLNSPGGDVQQGLAIYDSIQGCTSVVNITVIGEASSMAAWILQAGDYRVMHKYSVLMLHVGEEGYESNHPRNVESEIKYNRHLEKVTEDIMLEKIRVCKPNYTRKQLRHLIQFDKYLTAGQALELGLVDMVKS